MAKPDLHPAFLHPGMQVANTLAAHARAAHTVDNRVASSRKVLALQASSIPTASPAVRAHTMIADPLSPITRR